MSIKLQNHKTPTLQSYVGNNKNQHFLINNENWMN